MGANERAKRCFAAIGVITVDLGALVPRRLERDGGPKWEKGVTAQLREGAAMRRSPPLAVDSFTARRLPAPS
jgi:hypothetical protein